MTTPKRHVLKRHSADLVLARVGLPLAVFGAVAALAWVLKDPVASRESLFLALWAGLGVAVLSALGWPHDGRGGQRLWPVATAVLLVAAAWAGHYQPYRGAALSIIFLLGLSLAAWTAWQRRAVMQSTGTEENRLERLDAAITVPLALGLQLLLRPELLLWPRFELRPLVSLIVLPVAAGVALAILAERFDARRVALAGAVVLILGPGWNVTTTLALLALAAGSIHGNRLDGDELNGDSPNSDSLNTENRRAAWFRWAAIVGLVLLPWWLGGVGVLFVLAAVALALAPSATGGFFVILAATVGVGALVPTVRDKPQAIFMLLAVLSMVPSALLATPEGRWRMRVGGMIALIASQLGQGPEALAAGAALMALGMPIRGAIFECQRAWTATVLLGTCVLAAYPWMRVEPRGAWLRLLGIEPRGTDLLIPFVLVIGLGTLLHLSRRLTSRWTLRSSWLIVPLLAWALLQGHEGVTVLRNSYQAVTLNAEDELLRLDFVEQPVRSVVVDSNLVRGLKLPAGTVVADVVLRDATNKQLFSWPLKVGVHTAEWAIERDGVAERLGLQVPHPWVSQIAAEGTFFAHRFRGRFSVAAPPQAAKLHIRRRAELPEDVQLVIYRLELRR